MSSLILPEIDIESGSKAKDNDGVDDIPFVPTGTGSGNLLRGRGTEHQTLDLLLVRSLGAEGDDDDNQTADNQHDSTEIEPVEVVEYCLEPVVGSICYITVVNLGTQTGQTDDDT